MTGRRNLGLRVLSAVVLVPPLLFAIFHPHPGWFTVIVLAAAAIAQGEFYWFALSEEPTWVRVFGIALGLGVSASMILGASPTVLLGAILLAIVACSLLQLFWHSSIQRASASTGMLVLGVFYVPLMLGTIAQLKRLPAGGRWVVLLLAITWMSDTAAYFVGKAFGKRPLYPAISPSKSWEGAIGGVLGSVGAVLAAKLSFMPLLGWADVLLMAIPGSAMGQLGDLVESMFKRGFGVKDSGRILPGHGGLLDRIDALLFTAPYVYLYAVYVVVPRTSGLG